MTGSVRTFVAFFPPEHIRLDITALQRELERAGADVRWERASNLHLTLNFLGDVPEQQLPELQKLIALSLQDIPSFPVVYQELGSFPDNHRPRVIWLGCKSPTGMLAQVKDRLDGALTSIGFPSESRPFHPHITLGRVKSTRGLKHLTPMLESLTFEPRESMVDGILVMRSMLRPQGAEYSVVCKINLGTH